jgi:hypothetical protein
MEVSALSDFTVTVVSEKATNIFGAAWKNLWLVNVFGNSNGQHLF